MGQSEASDGLVYRGGAALVTGGTGFLGSHIVQELLTRGANVRVPINRRALRIQDPKIETIAADLSREEDCRTVARGVDWVFHAAGPGGSAGKSALDAMEGIRTNLVLASQMLHAAWAEGVDRFLMLSSTTVYPPADYPITEEEAWDGPTHPSYFGYGWMHRYLERLCEFVASRSTMRIALVRAGAVYGQWDNFDPKASHVVPALIRKAVEKQDPYEVWGTGEDIWDFLHVTDLAQGCLLMLEKYAECDPVNLGSGRGTAIKDLVRVILEAAGHEEARVEFSASKPTTSPVRLVDVSKAGMTLGFKPKMDLEEGIADTLRWYQSAREGLEQPTVSVQFQESGSG